ncbi:DUF4981 domain-containing protein [Natronolimnobius sp. AArcel1]|uniref:glycoside hydrolase family 2 TIM barrel-domain containing protein n=1 Tax=Natronolimnobius sp. AArcel1 TaxID=1679093 RepID=UPI0013EA012D|nr:glycoside hydrolase family 2 TIM barrel-domain containing protein [Natronolimnobius sp. AArcel1]NGM71133.1 DUF4981 domain-containing protein [Natronolimnobius sp. AArcel1]
MSRAPTAIDSLSEYIENPERLTENTEPVRAPTIPYDSVDAALDANEHLTELEARWDHSPYFERLDGEWDFCWAERPADVPAALATDEWDTIPVPSVWQLHGYDRPIYRNHALTWERLPEVDPLPEAPDVPETFNPVGTYRRSVSVPDNWTDDQPTYLHFEGVKSAFFVWIDGEYVGYDQGSMSPSEFDVSEHLSPGSEHELMVQVVRFSDGSYLETQDMIRFSGIFRSVYLYATPPAHVQDYDLRTDLDAGYDAATLSLEADVHGTDRLDGDEATLVAHVFDAADDPVTSVETGLESATEATAGLETTINAPELWSAEDPTLYTLVLELQDEGGETLEAISHRFGVREYEIVDGVLQVNGEPVTIRGVNRHDHDPDGGRTVPFERALEDLRLMKQNNINAIRTAHYPHDLSVYALADELGLYVFDEANVETHFDLEFVHKHPEFHESFLERFRRMVDHHKNITSIVAWSTSNEAGTGEPHAAMAEYAHEVDGTRFVFHQGDGDAPYAQFHESMTGTAPFTDISGPRYPVPDTIAQFSAVDDRPMIMGEYAHAFCNSLGHQEAYWDLVDRIDSLQGGFIWEWANQTLNADVVADADEETDLWFGDDAFLLDGIVFSDLSPQPVLEQVKWTHQPFAVEPIVPETGVVTITNSHDFTNLSELEAVWELTVDGEVLEEGTLELDVPAGHTSGAIVPFETPDVAPGQQCYATIRLRLPADTDWAEAGHEIGFEQFEVPVDTDPAPAVRSGKDEGDLEVESTDDEITFRGDGFTYTFDTASGQFSELAVDGHPVATGGPQVDAFRAPVPNEGRIQSSTEWGYENQTEWESLGLDDTRHEVSDLTLEQPAADHAHLVVETAVQNPDDETLFEVTTTYDVHASGDIVLTTDIEPTAFLRDSLESWLPRLGIDFELPSSVTDLEWVGRGPHETYPDRSASGEIGRYSGSIADQTVPYRVPQTNGNKTDVSWASLTGPQSGLLVFGDESFTLRTDIYENLATADSPADLEPRDGTRLSIDAAVSGVGGTPVKPLAEYRVEPAPTTFTVALRPYELAAVDPAELARRTFLEK